MNYIELKYQLTGSVIVICSNWGSKVELFGPNLDLHILIEKEVELIGLQKIQNLGTQRAHRTLPLDHYTHQVIISMARSVKGPDFLTCNISFTSFSP